MHYPSTTFSQKWAFFQTIDQFLCYYDKHLMLASLKRTTTLHVVGSQMKFCLFCYKRVYNYITWRSTLSTSNTLIHCSWCFGEPSGMRNTEYRVIFFPCNIALLHLQTDSPHLEMVFKDIYFETLEFAQPQICPLTTMAKGAKIKWGRIFPYIQ